MEINININSFIFFMGYSQYLPTLQGKAGLQNIASPNLLVR